MQKLDDKKLAADDVVNRPEVAQGEIDAANAPTAQAGEAAAAFDPKDEAAAQLLVEEAAAAYRRFTGGEISGHKQSGLRELAEVLFSGLRRLPHAWAWRCALIALCIAAPAIPALIKISKPTTEVKTNVT